MPSLRCPSLIYIFTLKNIRHCTRVVSQSLITWGSFKPGCTSFLRSKLFWMRFPDLSALSLNTLSKEKREPIRSRIQKSERKITLSLHTSRYEHCIFYCLCEYKAYYGITWRYASSRKHTYIILTPLNPTSI